MDFTSKTKQEVNHIPYGRSGQYGRVAPRLSESISTQINGRGGYISHVNTTYARFSIRVLYTGADLGGGVLGRNSSRGGGGQVRGNFHILTSKKRTNGGGVKPPNPPPPDPPLIYNLTTLCLNRTFPRVDFMDVIMRDIPARGVRVHTSLPRVRGHHRVVIGGAWPKERVGPPGQVFNVQP